MKLKKNATNFMILSGFLMLFGCNPQTNDADTGSESMIFTGSPGEIKIVTLDPGHFHAALVQKYQYDQVDSTVHIYAPEGPDLEGHLSRINSYNQRSNEPTNWNSIVHASPDFLQNMIREKPGNVVIISGNNGQKTKYIQASIEAGLNVLSDKPMAIKPSDFTALQAIFQKAEENKVLLYDIMTERYEMTTMMQKALSQIPGVFGELETGSPDSPAITKESVHHFFKYVSGQALIRPAWFFDVEQQGEGVADVSTHLVDLVFWECFPEKIIDYVEDIEILKARRWATAMSAEQFQKVTGLDGFPDYLQKDIVDDTLRTYSNGEISFTVNGIHARVSVIWNYQAPEGTGDTHYSIMRGSKANLVIRQGAEQNYRPALYVEPIDAEKGSGLSQALTEAIDKLNIQYPGLSFKESKNGWEVIIPDEYKVGHEAHFAQVTEKYLKYLVDGKLPAWEVPNMLSKYFVTTKAFEMSRDDR